MDPFAQFTSSGVGGRSNGLSHDDLQLLKERGELLIKLEKSQKQQQKKLSGTKQKLTNVKQTLKSVEAHRNLLMAQLDEERSRNGSDPANKETLKSLSTDLKALLSLVASSFTNNHSKRSRTESSSELDMLRNDVHEMQHQWNHLISFQQSFLQNMQTQVAFRGESTPMLYTSPVPKRVQSRNSPNVRRPRLKFPKAKGKGQKSIRQPRAKKSVPSQSLEEVLKQPMRRATLPQKDLVEALSQTYSLIQFDLEQREQRGTEAAKRRLTQLILAEAEKRHPHQNVRFLLAKELFELIKAKQSDNEVITPTLVQLATPKLMKAYELNNFLIPSIFQWISNYAVNHVITSDNDEKTFARYLQLATVLASREQQLLLIYDTFIIVLQRLKESKVTGVSLSFKGFVSILQTILVPLVETASPNNSFRSTSTFVTMHAVLTEIFLPYLSISEQSSEYTSLLDVIRHVSWTQTAPLKVLDIRHIVHLQLTSGELAHPERGDDMIMACRLTNVATRTHSEVVSLLDRLINAGWHNKGQIRMEILAVVAFTIMDFELAEFTEDQTGELSALQPQASQARLQKQQRHEKDMNAVLSYLHKGLVMTGMPPNLLFLVLRALLSAVAISGYSGTDPASNYRTEAATRVIEIANSNNGQYRELMNTLAGQMLYKVAQRMKM